MKSSIIKDSILGFCLLWLASIQISCSGSKSFTSWDTGENTFMRIDSLCNAQMATGHFPGLAIAVASGKSSLWSKGYGYANLENKVPIDADDHLFRIGSVSKTITAATLARLTERGEIDLDVPISSYYTNCPSDKASLTLRQLGGHLGGIRHYQGFEFFSNIAYHNVIDPLEVFIHDTLLCVPGEEYNYSTYGWTLISAVMNKAKKEPFTSLVYEEVNVPLKLEDLKPDYKDSTQFHRVTFYENNDSTHIQSPEVDNSNKWAGGGFLCSAEDVAKFGHANLAPGYLKKKTRDEFIRSQATSDGKLTDYGIGFNNRKDKSGRQWIGHSGGSVGGTSMLLIYPEEELVVVTLVNMSSAQMDNLAFRIAEIILSGKK